ncbi:hypothetical protein P7H17_10875 [Paenibacillus larvae]|nr:hypothetical protein [Paenibacillus larvae]MDT2286474.1 hypothetical protein [Paenibacillus larvae]MDT2293071.1 hypothetical protein [Paenibacillus larvae]
MNGLEQSRFAKVWKKVLSAAQGLLSPRVSACPGCNQPAVLNTRQMGLCQICYTGIPWIREVICPICGRYEECGDCLRREETCFIRNRSAVRYDESMKELLARYKYRGDEQLSSLFGEMLLFAYFCIRRRTGTWLLPRLPSPGGNLCAVKRAKVAGTGV